jgi:hypothetical protein
MSRINVIMYENYTNVVNDITIFEDPLGAIRFAGVCVGPKSGAQGAEISEGT